MLLDAGPAWCYRPYDSTDADVASKGELEVEFGFSQARLTPVEARDWGLVLNYGLGGDRELVLEGARMRTEESGFPAQTSFSDVALSLKQVLRRGTLQQQSGISVGVECGALTSQCGRFLWHQPNMGAQCRAYRADVARVGSRRRGSCISPFDGVRERVERMAAGGYLVNVLLGLQAVRA